MITRNWQIARILGIPIKVHGSWFLVFAFLTWSLASGYFPEALPGLSELRYWGMGGVAALLLFVSVLLHELGHSYVALKYRVPIGQITLFFFGGMAQMRREPPSPRAEFMIAIAGPIVSLVLAGVLFWAVSLSNSAQDLGGLVVLGGMLGSINLTIGVFNLIPGFPLDGGRVLRAGLWAWSGDFYRATSQAAVAGQGFGVAFGLLGVGFIVGALAGVLPGAVAANGVWVLLIGTFLFVVAKGGRHQAALRGSLARMAVREVMVRQVITLQPDLSVEEAVTQYFLAHGYRAFPVVEGGRLIGMLTVSEVHAIPQSLWGWRRVRDIMQPWHSVMEVSPEESLLFALDQMTQDEQNLLGVVQDGVFVGLLTRSGLSHALQLRGPVGPERGRIP